MFRYFSQLYVCVTILLLFPFRKAIMIRDTFVMQNCCCFVTDNNFLKRTRNVIKDLFCIQYKSYTVTSYLASFVTFITYDPISYLYWLHPDVPNNLQGQNVRENPGKSLVFLFLCNILQKQISFFLKLKEYKCVVFYVSLV